MSTDMRNNTQGRDLDPETLNAIRGMVDDSEVGKSAPKRMWKRGKETATQAASVAKPKYRPKMKHILLAVFALLVIFRPWLMLSLALLLFVCIFGSILAFGYDVFWKKVMAVGRWYARMRPSETPELNARLDAFVAKWDAFLDRFPEGSVDDYYMPDFNDLAKRDLRHDEAMSRRLAEMDDQRG